jgi:hypothetical protein
MLALGITCSIKEYEIQVNQFFQLYFNIGSYASAAVGACFYISYSIKLKCFIPL